jgi:acyl-coenzyme A synthetase/AMP-(fatty) acid ligase
VSEAAATGGLKPSVSAADMLRARGAASPGADAIVSEDARVSFGALLDRVDRMIGLLCREGWTPGMVVGVAMRDADLHLATALALLCLGDAQVCLPSHETSASNRSTMGRLGVSLVVCDERRDWMDGVRAVVVDERTLAAAPSGLAQARPAQADAAAVYVKTSGSTDVPKLFPLSFARLAGAAARTAAEPKERRVMRTSSIEFDSTRIYRLYALFGGCATVIAPRDIAALGSACRRLDVSQVHIGTYALASLLNGGRALSPMPETTSLLTGGSRVPGPLRAAIAARLSRNLWISYATSEIGQISLATPDEHEEHPEGVGRPRPEAEVEIVDAEGRPVARGEVGEIRARRPAAPKAYVGQEASSSQFRDGWFYPNDLISWPDDGPLIYHGRADDVMLLNGVKISGGAIEDALAAHADVREVAAFPLPSRLHGEIPAAAVVLAPGAERADAAALLAHCRTILGLRAPRRIVVVDAIPRTPTGKPLKRELAAL